MSEGRGVRTRSFGSYPCLLALAEANLKHFDRKYSALLDAYSDRLDAGG